MISHLCKRPEAAQAYALGRRHALKLGLLLGLGGCGFRPVYMRTSTGSPGVTARELAAVNVGVIPDRPGQLLRQALQQRFEGSGSGVPIKYDLDVSYSIGGEGLGIQPDNAVTRLRLIARGSWTLRAATPQRQALTSGTARAMDGADIIQQQYFALDLNVETVQRRLANEIADQITIQLAAYFRHQAAA